MKSRPLEQPLADHDGLMHSIGVEAERPVQLSCDSHHDRAEKFVKFRSARLPVELSDHLACLHGQDCNKRGGAVALIVVPWSVRILVRVSAIDGVSNCVVFGNPYPVKLCHKVIEVTSKIPVILWNTRMDAALIIQ